MNCKKMACIFAVLIVLSCLSISVVSAHRLHIVSTLSELEIEAYFAGGAPVQDGDVKVYDKGGILYIEGVTDEEGKFRFPPKIGMDEYEVVVDATHMPGHRGETTINLGQVSAGADGAETEMPLYSNIIAGFGYLIGIAGFAMAYMYWKQKKRYEKEQK